MTIFYFTSTGNSLAVAKRIGGEIGGESGALVPIPQIINAEIIQANDRAVKS
jgi:flavodoxin